MPPNFRVHLILKDSAAQAQGSLARATVGRSRGGRGAPLEARSSRSCSSLVSVRRSVAREAIRPPTADSGGGFSGLVLEESSEPEGRRSSEMPR